eukprot:jgi/Astpho2/4081/Aster-x0190
MCFVCEATLVPGITTHVQGVTASFSGTGEAQELPAQYVPQEFRNWEVRLVDWQTQCSMLATDEGLTYSLKRLMPTVGCEADAQAFTEDSRTALRSMQHPDEDKTVLACGCYSAGPRNLGAAGDQARFEHCLMINDGERVRIVQELKQDRGAWKASTVEVHHEKYEEPYTGRNELSGCGGGMSNFGAKPALEQDQLSGSWTLSSGRSYKVL